MLHAIWMLLRHPINTLAISKKVEIKAVLEDKDDH